MENTEKPASSDAPITQPRDKWWVRFVGYVKSEMDERAAKKQKEAPTDRAARVTANATLWIAIFTFVSLAVSVGTFLILRSQLREMHDGGVDTHNQVTLLRQQVIGTQAAVVVVAEYPGIELPNYGFNIGLRNDGHVVASKIKVSLNARREIVSGAQLVGEFWHCDYDLPPLAPTKVGEHQCFLQGLDKRSWQPIGDFKQTVAVDGTFSYWNGFEDVLGQPICLRYIPSGLKSTFGSEGPGSFVTCDRYPGWIEYLKERMAGSGVGLPQPPRQ